MVVRKIGNFLGASKIQKGAFIIEGALFPRIIQFQFNPIDTKRTLKLITGSGKSSGGTEQDLRTDKYLSEEITIKLKLDGLYKPSSDGILPILSALEQLVEPDEPSTLTQMAMGAFSTGHKNPPKWLPKIVFAWGDVRLLPIVIKTMIINETEYYPNLVPYRAEVDITMETLIPEISGDLEGSRLEGAYKWTKKKTKKRARMYFTKNLINPSAMTELASYLVKA